MTSVAKKQTPRHLASAKGTNDFEVLTSSELGPHATPPKKRKRWRTVVSTILFVVAIALFAVAGYQWYDAQRQYAVQEEINEKLAGYATVPSDGSQPPTVDWAGLKAINADVCAWLQIPGTVVNYPVYQGATNETYLRTTAEGNYSVGGQLFLDCDNTSPDLVDEQTIVYGHHLKDGSMFAQVAAYDEQDFLDTATTVWWCTEQGTYQMTPLFAYHVTGDDETVRQFEWDSVEDFRSYLLAKLAGAASQREGAADVIARTDHVLTLATCNYIDGKGRTVVVCVPQATFDGTTATEAATSE